jgi:Holliday junction resolvase RusA-like endonuclease
MEGRVQLQGPTRVRIRAYMPMPQALAKHKIKGPSAEAGVIRPLTKPDVDNMAKVIDALNGIVWPTTTRSSSSPSRSSIPPRPN